MRLHEIVNKDKIEKKLLEYFDIVGTYVIKPDGSINVDGSIASKKNTKHIMNMIPVKFSTVSKHFSLKEVPISSLENAPTYIGGMLNISRTFLDNLDDLKNINLDGTLAIQDCPITSLKGIQGMLHESFSIRTPSLTSLEGGPLTVNKDFSIFNCKVSSLIGGPRSVGVDYDCRGNPLTTLEGLPSHIGRKLYISYDRELPLLRILSVNGLKSVKFWPEYPPRDYIIEVERIMNNYLGQGRKGAIQCAAELIKAGYKDNARL